MYYILTLVLVFILDQASKRWVMYHFNPGEGRIIIDGVLQLLYIKNPGAAFGILQGQSWFFFLAAILVVFILSYYIFHYRPVGRAQIMAGLIVGGALGNALDRILYRSVVDFISVGWWPVFNLADMAIVAGGFLLAFHFFILEKGDDGDGD